MGNTNNEIYYGYDTLFKQQETLLAKETFSERNKALIRAYQSHLFAKGASGARVGKLTWCLRKVCRLLNKDLDTVVKVDIEQLVARIHNEQYTANTKADYKKAIKQFYGWFEDDDPRLESKDDTTRREAVKVYRYLKKNVITTVKNAPIDPGSVISPADIQKVIRAGCKNDMERAFISTLHASGARIGELLGLRRKDILKELGVWVLRVDGKTGERPIPIRSAIPELAIWLNNHPDTSPEAFVWVSRHGKPPAKRLKYSGARRMLLRCFERAGLGKLRNNPHWFRHSRCTLNAKKFNDAICCKLAGHSPQTMKRYRHLSGDDVINAFRQAHGLGGEPEADKEPEPTDCEWCGAHNTTDARYCVKCGKPLSMRVAIKDEERKTEAINEAVVLLSRIMADPKQREAFEKFTQQAQQ